MKSTKYKHDRTQKEKEFNADETEIAAKKEKQSASTRD